MEPNNVLFAFGLTLFAGLSTGIGGLLTFFTKRTNYKFLSVALGFSAGVMIYVSMIEIFPEARTYLSNELGTKLGSWVTVISFFAGIFLIAMIDKFVPSNENPHEMRKVEEIKVADYIHQKEDEKKQNEVDEKNEKLKKTGLATAFTIALHNFPEGLATFVSSMEDPTLGVPIAIAIAIHNIPEGISVAVPIYFATGSRKEALKLSLASGLAEPLGAIVGYLLLYNIFDNTKLLVGITLGMVAGIMVFISLDELLPTAREYAETHLSIYGLVAGMMVMAVSLLLMM